MAEWSTKIAPLRVQEFTDALIRVGLVGMLVVLCFRVFSPFMNLMMWALILAVTLYPMHQKLVGTTGGSQGMAASLIVIAGLVDDAISEPAETTG